MGEWSVTMKNPSKSMHASIVYGANIISNSQQMPKHIRVINQKTKSNFDAIFLFLLYFIVSTATSIEGCADKNYYYYNDICFPFFKLNLFLYIQTFSVFPCFVLFYLFIFTIFLCFFCNLIC